MSEHTQSQKQPEEVMEIEVVEEPTHVATSVVKPQASVPPGFFRLASRRLTRAECLRRLEQHVQEVLFRFLASPWKLPNDIVLTVVLCLQLLWWLDSGMFPVDDESSASTDGTPVFYTLYNNDDFEIHAPSMSCYPNAMQCIRKNLVQSFSNSECLSGFYTAYCDYVVVRLTASATEEMRFHACWSVRSLPSQFKRWWIRHRSWPMFRYLYFKRGGGFSVVEDVVYLRLEFKCTPELS
jgi:hypothetical protein